MPTRASDPARLPAMPCVPPAPPCLPRVLGHTPLYFADRGSRRWRVYDERPSPDGAVTPVPPGDPGATHRLFVAEGGGWAFGARLTEVPDDLSAGALRRQLAAALRFGPRRRRGESEAAHRERYLAWDAGYRARGY